MVKSKANPRTPIPKKKKKKKHQNRNPEIKQEPKPHNLRLIMETHFPKQVITSTKQSLSPKTPITTKDTHGSSFIYTLFHTKMLNRGESDVYIT